MSCALAAQVSTEMEFPVLNVRLLIVLSCVTDIVQREIFAGRRNAGAYGDCSESRLCDEFL